MSNSNSSNNGAQDAWKGLNRANDPSWSWRQRETYNANYTYQQNNQNQSSNGSSSGKK